MADYFPGTIMIGGKLPAGLLDGFLAEIASTHVSLGDYGGPAFACTSVEELLQSLDEKGHLVLADAEAPFGMFEGLEAFCVAHGIPFNRHSDARHEFDAENVRFRAGMERPVRVPSDNAGDDLLDAGKIRPVAKELARLATAGLDREALLAAVVKASEVLAEALPPEVEPLSPLQVE